MNQSRTIGVVGLWHLGEVYSACLAEIGHTVIGFSDDMAVVENLRKNVPPLAEPKLAELLEKNQKEGQLSFTTDFSKVQECDVVWITFDVPVDDNDFADISVVISAIEKVVPFLKQSVTIAVSSQIPVGTSQSIIDMLKKMRPELSFGYFYSPENLRLGEGVKCFMEEQRFVVGASSEKALSTAKEIYSPLPAKIISMSPASAEMTKHALNAWLATSIGFANDLADVSERVGADVEDVIKALKAEPRIGEKAYLFAGLGFAGWSIARDLKALMTVGEREHIPLPIISGAYTKNKSRGAIVLQRLKSIFGEIRGRKITLFGVAYKAGTPALNHSLSLWIDTVLREEGAEVSLYDPLANAAEVASHTNSHFFADPYEAANGAEIIIVPVADFKLTNLDFKRLASGMKTPFIFDAQNILISKEAEIRAAGFTYSSIGR